MMNGKLMLYVDQWGHRVYARTIKELRESLGGGKVSKMYRDKKNGPPVHIGYVVGHHWCEAFVPYEGQA